MTYTQRGRIDLGGFGYVDFTARASIYNEGELKRWTRRKKKAGGERVGGGGVVKRERGEREEGVGRSSFLDDGGIYIS